MICNNDIMQKCGKNEYKYDYIYSCKGHLQVP
jgi:hypothetical protein